MGEMLTVQAGSIEGTQWWGIVFPEEDRRSSLDDLAEESFAVDRFLDCCDSEKHILTSTVQNFEVWKISHPGTLPPSQR